MKKHLLLLSLGAAIITTSSSSMSKWQKLTEIKQKMEENDKRGFSITLSEGFTWEDFHRAQWDAIELNNIGKNIEKTTCKNNSTERPFRNELLTTTANLNIDALLEEEKSAPRSYAQPETQAMHESLIKELKELRNQE